MEVTMTETNLNVPNLDEIERLLNQSMNGIHVLFNNNKVAAILKKPTEELDFFNFERIDKIQTLFTKLVECPSLIQKQEYISNLHQDEFEILVRTYFHIVDNSLLAANRPRH